MKRNEFRRLLCMLLCVLMTVAVSTPSAAAERTVTDSAGRETVLPDRVERAVCIGVGALRYTCYLGAADRIVGVEDYESKPTMLRLYNYVNYDRFCTLPVIGTNGVPFPEELIALDPQVILLSAYAGVDPEELTAKTGIPVVTVPGSDAMLDEKSFETLEILGRVFSLEQRAEALTDWLQQQREELDRRTADIPEEEKPMVYVGGVAFQGYHGFEGTEAGYGPLALIHARNLADETGRTGAFSLDPEQVLAWDPEVILLDYNGLELLNEDYRTNPEFYDCLTAVQEGRVYAQISFRSFAVNLDTALADAWYAGTVLYPHRFADVDMEEKSGEIYEMLLGADPREALKEAGYAFRPIVIGE